MICSLAIPTLLHILEFRSYDKCEIRAMFVKCGIWAFIACHEVSDS